MPTEVRSIIIEVAKKHQWLPQTFPPVASGREEIIVFNSQVAKTNLSIQVQKWVRVIHYKGTKIKMVTMKNPSSTIEVDLIDPNSIEAIEAYFDHHNMETL